MIEKFNYSMVPIGFAHCFQKDCKKAGQCLRFQITRYIPNERWAIPVLNPAQARPEGDCAGFMSDQPVKYACGTKHLLDNLLHSQAKEVKAQLLAHYGKASFYRFSRKEKNLTPEDQQYIRRVFRQHGITDEPVFDSYLEGYNWNKA